jgi:isopenicillin-N epimerase
VSLREHFVLDPGVTFLNHGSFGACPRVVLEAQQRLRDRMEREPVRFLAGELQGLLDAARGELAAFVGAAPADLVFVPNATAGVNAVLRSLDLRPGDELLVTDHAYHACRNALDWVAARSGAHVVVAAVPFPLDGEEPIIEAVLGTVTPRTRLALLDHVTSPTGLIYPLRRLAAALAAAGVDVLVDGAHAPGMVPLDIAALGVAYYTGNCHKWLCAPKGAGFLVTRPDRQEGLVPNVISHGLTAPLTRPRYQLLFDWVGTMDPTPWLCVPEALRVIGGLVPGGWPEVRARNHELALAARALLLPALGVPAPAPESLLGALVAIPIGPGDPLELHARVVAAGFQVPVFAFGGQRVLRVATAIYNELAEVERLAAALPGLLSRP